jgi:hypothetical protein
MKRSVALSGAIALCLTAVPAIAAEGGHQHHHPMPMPMPSATPTPAASPMPMDHDMGDGMEMDHGAMGHDMAGHDMMGMAHDPLMMRARAMGSGTSWIPALSPMRMWSLRTGDWLWMLHGDLVGGYNQQGGPRGAAVSPTWAAENWQMLMGSRYLGPGILDLHLMTSLEGLTLPAGGTPQLFQTGESYQNKPLLDRQHPHDLLDELSARYTWNLTDATALFAYGALAGEPALGPTAFMHRPSAADNHWAPLAHHLQDSTHITYGVATAGVRQGPFQLEGSLFNGREPDENRFVPDFGPLDSWSGRLSWFPGPNWALQTSYGQLKEPEALEPGDVHRTTASVMNVQEYPWGWWSTSLVWGQNRDFHGASYTLQSYGLESQLDAGANHGYGRFELVDKTGLALTGEDDHAIHRVGALTLGAIRDLDTSDAFDLGLGADATVYSLDAATKAAYGDNPVSFRVYLRLRPPTMQH